MSQSSPKKIILGKNSKLISFKAAIDKVNDLEIKKTDNRFIG